MGNSGPPPPPPPPSGPAPECPVDYQCTTTEDCEDTFWNEPGRKLTKLEEGRRLQPIPIGPPIIPICMHGWEPIWEAVGGTCEGDCDFFPEPEEGNSRRNLRFGITGGGGCCIPWFAPGYLY